jgi:NAD(P)-dependent dehydrogenase (short-subunit alcohol dehydrogenase family)
VPPDHVVVHVVAAGAPALAVDDMSDADIESLYDAVVRDALSVLQVGRVQRVTRFVFVIPSIAERGAGGYAATCAAAEAVRVLALGAARQWTGDGVTVNCLAAPWPYAASLDDDIAPLVAFLASDAAALVTGETIRVGGPVSGL